MNLPRNLLVDGGGVAGIDLEEHPSVSCISCLIQYTGPAAGVNPFFRAHFLPVRRSDRVPQGAPEGGRDPPAQEAAIAPAAAGRALNGRCPAQAGRKTQKLVLIPVRKRRYSSALQA
ncbi:MAG: hypothetical protein Kow0040_18930 [Thermogutta sp.]